MAQARRTQGVGGLKLLPRQGPVARKGRGQPLRVCPPEGINGQRCPTKNGVLVPLPPWAKEPAAGAAEYSFGESSFLFAQKGTKNAPGFVSEERQRSSRQPRTPLRGTLPWGRSSHPARAVQGIADPSAPLPLAGGFGRAVRLDQKSAPGASSRRGWFGCGPVGTPAPTPNLWIFVGGWYPPLRNQRRGDLKKSGRVGDSLVQTAEMADQHLTNISGGGAVGILG